MKKLIAGVAVMIAVLGFAGAKEAKADYDTLAGVADIIYATGTFVNGGYGETVVYEPYYRPYPVYRYYDYGYPRYRSYHHYRHYPRYYRNHCY